MDRPRCTGCGEPMMPACPNCKQPLKEDKWYRLRIDDEHYAVCSEKCVHGMSATMTGEEIN
jgi:hypothetical protein